MSLHSFVKSFSPYKSTAALSEKLCSGVAGGFAIMLLAWALYGYLYSKPVPIEVFETLLMKEKS